MIKAENVSISYRMPHDKIQSIKEYLVALIKRKLQYEEFHALTGVSFEIKKGEIGIVLFQNRDRTRKHRTRFAGTRAYPESACIYRRPCHR